MTEPTQFRVGLERLGLVLVLPVLIAATVAGFTYTSYPDPATQYLATAVIKPPSTVDSPSAVNLFIADMSELITEDAAVDHVISQVPSLDRESYLERITSVRRGTTSSVELTFLDPDRAVAEATVGTLARWVLDDVARSEYELTQFLLERATERLDQAEAEIERFFGTVSVFDPEFEYRSLLNEIAQLDQQITTGRALSYGDTYLAELTARKAQVQARLPALGEAMLTHGRLSTELSNAQDAWEEATLNNDLAEFEYRTVNSTETLITSEVVDPFVDEVPRLQTTALAAVGALLLSLLVVLPFSAWLGRPRGRHKTYIDGAETRTVDLDALEREDPSRALDTDQEMEAEAGRRRKRGRRSRRIEADPEPAESEHDVPTDDRQLELFQSRHSR
jgi:hypothetical protein